ncbi:hypothetical protein [Viridibacillus arvi]|uniref:hypothetical protein n=1 Tax=Viridibacillus arvi TaxID=263475 RepID=UPI00187B3EC0|nr:hypothetical protein [Viridibacillus sp. JNUCC-6]QOV11042.1 hypothetical protein JNUCC6_21175 [Viridibacillus sp. JNUCC-6]
MQIGSEKLKNEFKDMKVFCEENDIDIYYNNLSIIEEEEESFQNIINAESEVKIYLPRDAVDDTCDLYTLIEMVNESKKGYFLNDYTFVSEKISYIRIGTSHVNFQYSGLSEMNFRTNITFEGIAYNVDIVSGVNSFNFKLAEEGKYNKYVPAYLEEDIFIEIESDENIDVKLLDVIFDSYFFELKTTYDLDIRPMPWEYELWDFVEEVYDETENVNLRPLLQGRGIKELLKIYKSAFHTSYPEQQILSFSRAIEYVSQTVISKDLIEKTMTKLSSKRALSPDSTYILELGKIFDEHRDLGKDYQAFKITIETCCDIFELVRYAPSFLKKTNKVTLESKTDTIQQAFAEIVNSVTATRNMFAHAKTNYKSKGVECPEDQLEEFSKLMDIIAQQTIRWFAVQKEENRIV